MIPSDIVTKFGDLQTQIWQVVTLTASEAANQAVNFTSPLTLASRTADLYGEITVPMIVLQFAFTGQPENSQIILVPHEAGLAIYEGVKGARAEDIDENVLTELRAPLEGIVQGVCLAVGNIKNETIVATGLSIRYQIFSFPPNMLRSDEIVRTQLGISGDDISGTLTWLIDPETVHFILGIPMVEEDEGAAFPIAGNVAPGAAPGGQSEGGSLELLMDIPLEISVELGRVKMLVREIVELGNGSIIEIDKAAGELVDVMVNGRLVARGEVVVIEDNFGVRITEILNPHERLARLGDAA